MFFFFNLHSGIFMWNKRMGVLGFGGLRKHCRLSGLLLLQLCCAGLRCCDCSRFVCIVLTLDLGTASS